MKLLIRSRLRRADADRIIELARQFFADRPRKRVFRVGDATGAPWFVVRKQHIEADVNAHCGPASAEFVK